MVHVGHAAGQKAVGAHLVRGLVVHGLRLVPHHAQGHGQLRVGFQVVRPQFVEVAEDFECWHHAVGVGVDGGVQGVAQLRVGDEELPDGLRIAAEARLDFVRMLGFEVLGHSGAHEFGLALLQGLVPAERLEQLLLR